MKNSKLLSILLSQLVIGLFFFGSTQLASAANDHLEYPELMVTPRASDRLEMEAKKEPEKKWTTHLAVQATGLTTLVASLVHKDKSVSENGSKTNTIGTIVGGTTLLTATALAAFYEPYQSAAPEVRALPKGTQRQKLARERMAEEAINSAASLGSKIRWAAFIANFATSLFMVTKAETGTSQYVDLVAAGASFAPLLFPYRWNKVADEQRSYKKKIYGPVASTTLFADPVTKSVTPGLALSFRF